MLTLPSKVQPAAQNSVCNANLNAWKLILYFLVKYAMESFFANSSEGMWVVYLFSSLFCSKKKWMPENCMVHKTLSVKNLNFNARVKCVRHSLCVCIFQLIFFWYIYICYVNINLIQTRSFVLSFVSQSKLIPNYGTLHWILMPLWCL